MSGRVIEKAPVVGQASILERMVLHVPHSASIRGTETKKKEAAFRPQPSGPPTTEARGLALLETRDDGPRPLVVDYGSRNFAIHSISEVINHVTSIACEDKATTWDEAVT